VVRRFAFTLIELIFAIVVIAISVVSLPMMNQAISKGIDGNILQEAIFAAAGELNEATTAYWDENSLEVNATNAMAKVIDSGNCENNSSLSTYRLMPGHISQPFHRRCLDSNLTTPSDANASVLIDSLDDKRHGVRNIFVFTTKDPTKDKTGYKDIYTSTVDVNRTVNFGLTPNNPDIKSIVSTIRDSNGIIVLLRTYSCNIGEVEYDKKEY
jgi:Tfp pilus assembly protein PilE